MESKIPIPVMSEMDVFRTFIYSQSTAEAEGATSMSRLAGQPIDVSYEKVVLATCDAYKTIVGQIARGDLLVMIRRDEEKPDSFTLLRVRGDAPVPLDSLYDQTRMELTKQNPVSLDRLTQADLQWNCLDLRHSGDAIPQWQGRLYNSWRHGRVCLATQVQCIQTGFRSAKSDRQHEY